MSLSSNKEATILDLKAESSTPKSLHKHAAMALLREPILDKAAILERLAQFWGIGLTDLSPDDGTCLMCDVHDMFVAVSLVAEPVEPEFVKACAQLNYMWPQAQDAVSQQQAHVVVVVMKKPDWGHEGEVTNLDCARLLVKVMEAITHQSEVCAMVANNMVYEPKLYGMMAQLAKEGLEPTFNLVWVGIYETEQGLSAYTSGLTSLGKHEMEVLDFQGEPSQLHEFLMALADFVVTQNVTLKAGETIGFTPEDRHRIDFSDGVALPEKTFKISVDSAAS